MNAVLEQSPLCAALQLAEARIAYRAMKRAEAQMHRINGYRNKTPGMKDDLARASGIYRHNTQLHEKIMRGLL